MGGWCSYISSFCIKMTQNTPSFVTDDSLKINDVGGMDLRFLKDSEKVHGCVWDGEQLTSTSIHCILTSIWKIVCETTINVSYFVTWPYHFTFHYFKWISSCWLIDSRIWQQLTFYFFLGIQGELGKTLITPVGAAELSSGWGFYFEQVKHFKFCGSL